MISAAIVSALAALSVWHSSRRRKNNTKHHVIIIGASRGIGREVARLYATQTNVIGISLVARQARQLDVLRQELESCTRIPIDCFACDATRLENMHKAAAHCRDRIARQHPDAQITLILSLGTICQLALADMPDTDDGMMRNVLDTNLLAPIMLTRVFLDLMLQHGGTIAFISSIAGRFGAPTRSLYAASKHGVMGFADSLRMELRNQGVHVIALCPATVQTGIRLGAVEYGGADVISPDDIDDKGMSVGVCARAIVDGIERREREVWIPRAYGFLSILNVVSPRLVDYLASSKYAHRSVGETQ
jgi:short-subunit dehydrogenase